MLKRLKTSMYMWGPEREILPRMFMALRALSSFVGTRTSRKKQDESIALKDVIFQKGKFCNCTINVTIPKMEYYVALLK